VRLAETTVSCALLQFMRGQSEQVKYIETSLLNGFGLRQLYNFLNVPFLKMKMVRASMLHCSARALRRVLIHWRRRWLLGPPVLLPRAC
jgi:hypothetical protein